MYVHVEVLAGRGCLADLGAHESDQIVVRVGQPESRKGVAGMASHTIDAPILSQPTGVQIPPKLSSEIKHQITKRAFKRDLDKYQLRLYVLKHDCTEAKWLGIVALRLLCLTDGYVVERWVPMKPATKTEPGDLRLRIVVRESGEDAQSVLEMGNEVASHTTRSEGCCCDLCDPGFHLANPKIEYFDFNEKSFISNKAGRVIASANSCTIC